MKDVPSVELIPVDLMNRVMTKAVTTHIVSPAKLSSGGEARRSLCYGSEINEKSCGFILIGLFQAKWPRFFAGLSIRGNSRYNGRDRSLLHYALEVVVSRGDLY